MSSKASPVTVVVVVLLVLHNIYTLWIMRLAVERPPDACPAPREADATASTPVQLPHAALFHQDQKVFGSNRIAVVRPFIPGHLDRLLQDLALWEQPEFAPCKLDDENAPSKRVDRLLSDRQKPDLILYLSYPLDQFPDVVSTLHKTWADASWRQCFAHVRFISAGLDPLSDRYLPGQKAANSTREQTTEQTRPAPSGVVLMYYNLVLDPEFYETYEYFLYMEPDLTPIRARWLDQLRIECYGELHNFWVKGSIYAGPKYVSDETDTPWLFHINGNAIYHVADPEFRAYVRQVRQLDGALTNPFDVTMYEFRRRRFTLSQRTIHRFLYGEYIQNYGVSGYSLRKLQAEKPNTFLVHKKHQCQECDPVEP